MTRRTCNPAACRHNHAEMSGIFFDLPSVRFLRRFRFLEPMLQTIAASLLRWVTAPAYASRQVHFRHEAEFPLASQSAWKKVDWTVDDSRAADGVSNVIGALRPSDNWIQLKDQHELLFIWKTLTPPARWRPAQGKQRTTSEPRANRQDAEKDILATSCRIFQKRRGEKENASTAAQWFATVASGA